MWIPFLKSWACPTHLQTQKSGWHKIKLWRPLYDKVNMILALDRPEKSVWCSSDPETDFINVPQFSSHSLINILEFLNRNVSKKKWATLEDDLQSLPPLKSKYTGYCPKCSSISRFLQMFLRIQDPKIPVFSGSGTRLDNVIENVAVSSYPFAYYNGYTIFISAIEFTPILNFAYGKNCQVMQ